MRIVFCGSGKFGVPTLRAILADGHQVAGVVTQPARPAGRGGNLRPTPLAQAAAELELPVLELAKINLPDSVAAIRQLEPDVIAVVDFGQMVRAAVRETAPLGAFNLHASLLPHLRGAAPINWAIIRGHAQTGVTTFSLVDKMDAGDIYLQDATLIEPHETAEDLKARLSEVGASTVCRTLRLLGAGQIHPTVQDEAAVTLAPIMQKSDGAIDWSADAVTVRNRIHGTWPWPGGQALFHGQKHDSLAVVIARAEALPDAAATQPGILDHDLTVSTAQGRIRILEIQPAGKRLMPWRDFVNGYRVAAGDRLTTPTYPDRDTNPGR